MLTRNSGQKRLHDDGGKCRNNQSKRTQQSNDVRCWVCLDEGPDESGNGLVRDCSCRGHSGYAHVSCLVQYAEKTTEHRVCENRHEKYIGLWTKCPNCRTRYRNDLALELVNKCVSFVERKNQEGWGGVVLRQVYTHSHCIAVLTEELYALQAYTRGDTRREKVMEVAESVLSIIRDVIIHQNHFFRDEAYAYSMLGYVHEQKNTDESLAEDMKCFQKSRDLYASTSEKDLSRAELDTARVKLLREKDNPAVKEEYVKAAKQHYEFVCEEYGKDAYQTIRSGLLTADALDKANHGIEAERLYQKLLISSRQTHGPGNQTTKSIEVDYNAAKKRFVLIKAEEGKGYVMTDEGNHLVFKVLMYEKDSDSYVVLQYRKFSVESREVVVPNGTPVICHSMTGQEKHLTGKIGVYALGI